MLGGSEELMAHIEKKYDVTSGGTTADGKFTFKEFECLGACRHAPAVMVDKTYHECVTPDAIDKLIKKLD